MKKFDFEGDWEIKLNLDNFIDSNKNWPENPNRNTSQDSINIKFIDRRNFEPDPLKEQINSIEYIINNQNIVLENLCVAFNTINKKYGEYCGEHDWYPDTLSIDNLGSIFYLSEIAILAEHKDGQSYIQFNGEYKGDYEHGLIVVLHNGKLIGFDQQGGDAYNKIYEDLGEEKEVFRTYNIETREFGINMIHSPLIKYGKLKPWQLLASAEHFDSLFRSDKSKEIMLEIEDKNWDFNLKFSEGGRNIIEKAAGSGNKEIVQYLLSKGADISNSVSQCTSGASYNPDMIKFLIGKGASIDSIGYLRTTPLCREIVGYVRAFNNLDYYKERDKNRLEKTKLKFQEHINRIKFYISSGANPEFLDKEGNDYKVILRKEWNEDFLNRNKIFNRIEELIYPERDK